MKARAAIAVLALGLSGSARAAAPSIQMPPIQVLAAGSLSGAFTELAKAYTAHSGTPVATSFGASGLLLQRIEQGTPADVFASANMVHPQTLTREGKAGPTALFARNALCGIARPDTHLTTAALLDRILDPSIKLGTSTPKADPGGDYAWAMFAKAEVVKPGARATLETKALQLVGGPVEPAVPLGQNPIAYFLTTRQADVFLAYCSSGRAAGAGLETVALPAPLAVAGDYGIVALRGPQETAAKDFTQYVLSPEGQAVLARYGLQPAAGSGN